MRQRFIFTCALHLVLAAVSVPRPACAAEKLKVGVLAAFSGEWGAYGAAYRRGIELAGVDRSVEFIYEDDGFDPSKTVSAFSKLLDIDGIEAAIVGDTVTALAVSPIAEARGIPLLVWAPDDPRLAGKKQIFRLWTTYKKDLGAEAAELKRRQVQGKVSLFVSAHSYSSKWGETLAAALGEKLAAREEFPIDPNDYRSYIVREKARGTSLIGLCLNSGQNGLFAAQMKQLGIAIPLFACSFIESSADLSRAREALEGAWFIGTALSPEFVRRYERAAGTSDHLISAAVHYDAAVALAQAARGSAAVPLSERLAALGSIPGASGPVPVVVTARDRYFDLPLALFSVKNGRIEQNVD